VPTRCSPKVRTLVEESMSEVGNHANPLKSMRTEGETLLCLILLGDEDSNSGRQARTSVRLPLQPERVLNANPFKEA
jgi:hypothetical protein